MKSGNIKGEYKKKPGHFIMSGLGGVTERDKFPGFGIVYDKLATK